MDLLQKFKTGEKVYVKPRESWAKPAQRTIKTLTAKQVRFDDKVTPQFFNAVAAEGNVFTTLRGYYFAAVAASELAAKAAHHAAYELDQELVTLRAELAKHDGA